MSRTDRPYGKTYTKDECADSLRQCAEDLGHSPSAREYQQSGYSPSSRGIIKKFGSWNDAKEFAGLETKTQNNWNPEQ